MTKLANFTLHSQDQYIEKWREYGFEMDPTPRAPLIEFEREVMMDKEKTKIIRIRNVPESVHQAVKIQAVQKGISMEALVLSWIIEILKNKGGLK